MVIGKTAQRRLIVIVIIVAAVLRLWGLWGAELQSDSAHYAFRSLGLFDYLGDNKQTTPFVWFGSIPWWARFSFHDHPPLVFYVQWIFLWIGGDSTFVALLPSAFAGIASVLLVYYFIKRLRTEKEALIASALYAVSSLAVFSSRSGYLESIETLFIIISFGAFACALQEKKNSWLYVWGVSTGLALLSKYTAINVLFAPFVYLVLFDRALFKKSRFWISAAIPFIMLTPVIVYNIMVFMTRGHFDAAISTAVGMHPEDFVGLTRSAGVSLGSVYELTNAFIINQSGLLSLAILSALVGGTILSIRRVDIILRWVLVSAWTTIATLLLTTDVRYVTIALPIMCVLLSWGVVTLFQSMSSKVMRQALTVLFIAVISFEALYTVNSHLLKRPIGPVGIAYARDRFMNQGFQVLDEYLRKGPLAPLRHRIFIRTKDDADYTLESQDGTFVLFDHRIDWFRSMWYLKRYQFYYKSPMVAFDDLIEVMKKSGLGNANPFDVLHAVGTRTLILIYRPHQQITTALDRYVENIVSVSSTKGVKPIFTTYAEDGTSAFEVYRFDLSVEE